MRRLPIQRCRSCRLFFLVIFLIQFWILLVFYYLLCLQNVYFQMHALISSLLLHLEKYFHLVKIWGNLFFFLSSILGEFFPELRFRSSWSAGDGALALEAWRRIRAEDISPFWAIKSLFIALGVFSAVWYSWDWTYRGEVRDFLRTLGSGL